MRDVFIQELIDAARLNSNIVLIVGDLGYSVVEPFAEEFPERFINAGIAEQSMMSIAAGLASEGYHPFVYSIANFPTFRCAEQIRNDVAYHKFPVTIVAIGGGLSYGNLGYSHHAIQDYALIRSMPEMLIASPGDPYEVRACMRYLINNPQPSYLRLSKSGELPIHTKIPIIKPGVWLSIRKGNSNQRAYLTTGGLLNWVVKEAPKDSSIYSLPLWGMDHKDIQVNLVSKYNSVVTVEDHLKDGGMGSWMLEALSDYPNQIIKIRIDALSQSIFGMVGQQSVLNEMGGLTRERLCK